MPHKILIVDDDKISTTLIKFALADKRYDVTCAADGAQGLECVQEIKPDLIILDVHMPNMDGFEFIKELKRKGGYNVPPVIILTVNETMRDVFVHEGVIGYFMKPCNTRTLLSTIVGYLGENTE